MTRHIAAILAAGLMLAGCADLPPPKATASQEFRAAFAKAYAEEVARQAAEAKRVAP